MSSSLKERLARLARSEVPDPVPSGSPGIVVLRPRRGADAIRSIEAIRSLKRRGVSLLRAKRAIEEMLDVGRVIVHVPTVEAMPTFVAELRDCGVVATVLSSAEVDVRALRERLGLTQEQFALSYGLDLNSLQNWEIGRRRPDTAVRSYLRVIDRLPGPASEALEEAVPPA